MTSEEKLALVNFVLPLIKDLLTPRIDKILKSLFPTGTKPEDIAKKIEDYIINRYEKFSILDTLAFPNKQTLFKKLYIPLTLVCDIAHGEENIEILINKYPQDLFPKYYRILIEDTAGMGKSTIAKKLFLSIVDEKISIPVLIELRKIDSKNNILTEIKSQFSSIDNEIDDSALFYLIKNGEFIFLFDGYDEIPNSNRDFVYNELRNFIDKANKNYFIITSRPEDSLASFGDFQKFNIKPLEESEAFELIRQYDFYSHRKISKELIKHLVDKNDKNINEFLENPFLVSLLYKSFDYKKNIPLKKSQFYCQIYDALFESHDLSKEGYLVRQKYCNLDKDDFERVLRYLAYYTARENKIEYDKDYILNLISKLKTLFVNLELRSSDYLKDLIETVPVFKKDGNYYIWSHKSLQDYFAAKFIWIDAKKKHVKLRSIYDDKNIKQFYNMLDILYELDPKLFETTLLKWLLKDFKTYYFAKIEKNTPIPQSLIIQRIELTFGLDLSLIFTVESDFAKIIDSCSDNYMFSMRVFNIPISKKLNQRTFLILQHRHKPNISTISRIFLERRPNFKNAPQKDFMDVVFTQIQKFRNDKFYKINFNHNNFLNNVDNYELTNNLITFPESPLQLNSQKCLELLKEIIENEKKDMDDELLN